LLACNQTTSTVHLVHKKLAGLAGFTGASMRLSEERNPSMHNFPWTTCEEAWKMRGELQNRKGNCKTGRGVAKQEGELQNRKGSCKTGRGVAKKEGELQNRKGELQRGRGVQVRGHSPAIADVTGRFGADDFDGLESSGYGKHAAPDEAYDLVRICKRHPNLLTTTSLCHS